jgi:hypothetical protein
VEGRETLWAIAKMILASAVLGGVAYGVWWGIDHEIGAALWAQAVSVGTAILAGSAAYAVAVWLMRIEEARQISRLVSSRLRRA